ncbi:hypothetical protein DID75_04445, partial [Candidatus Marinamargulisbacteria bacterium SCGC AG-410-N11]
GPILNQQEFGLYVSGNAQISGNATLLGILNTNETKASAIFLNNQDFPDLSFLRTLYYLQDLPYSHGSLLIGDNNQWSVLPRELIKDYFGITKDYDPNLHQLTINSPTHSAQLAVNNNTLKVYKDSIGINTNNQSHTLDIRTPESNLKNQTLLTVSSNQFIIGSSPVKPLDKPTLYVDGDVRINGTLVGQVNSKTLIDNDFGYVFSEDPFYNQKNPTIYKINGSLGIGIGDNRFHDPHIYKTQARVDISSLDGYDKNHFTQSGLHYLSVRDTTSTTPKPYFIINQKGYIGVHTDSPKGIFQVNSKGLDGLAIETLVVTKNNIGIHTINPSASVHIVGKNGILVTSPSDNILFKTTQDGLVGIRTDNPISNLSVSGAITISDTLTTKPGTLFFKDNHYKVHLNNNKLASVGQFVEWKSQNGNLYVTSGNIGIGVTTPEAALHISGNKPLSISTPTNPDALYIKSGRLGLGTKNPQETVHLNEALIIATANNNLEGTIEYKDNTYAGYTQDNLIDLAHQIQWKPIQNGISSAFPIGIGQDSPSASLSVYDSFEIIDHQKNTQFIVSSNGFMAIGTNNVIDGLNINGAVRIAKKQDTNNQIGTIWYENNRFYGLTPAGKMELSSLDAWDSFGANYTTKALGINSIPSQNEILSVSGNIVFKQINKPIFSAANNQILVGNPSSNEQLAVSGSVLIGTSLNSPSFMISNEGLIGLGTNTPQSALHIKSNNPLSLGSKATPNMIVITSQSVGIGIKDPVVALDINGAITLSDSLEPVSGNIRYRQQNFEGYSNQKWSSFNSLISWYPTNNSDLFTNKLVAIGTKEIKDSLTVKGSLRIDSLTTQNLMISASGNMGINITPTIAALSIYGKKPLLIESLSTPNLFIISDNANIGIGTKNTEESISLDGAIVIGESKNKSPNSVYFKDNRFWFQSPDRPIELGSALSWDFKDNHFISTKSISIGTKNAIASVNIIGEKPIHFSTISEPNAFVITTNSKIGIATQFPESDFTISGNLLIESTQTKNMLVTNKQGQVGIGTDQFKAPLTIAGAMIVSSQNEEAPGMIRFSQQDQQFYIYKNKQWKLMKTPFVWSEDKQLKSVYFDKGPVSIGTKNVLADLTISGNLLVSQAQNPDLLSVTNNQKVGIGTRSPLATFHIKPTTNLAPLIIRNKTATLFTVSQNQNIGIGTSNPKVALSVSGSVRVKNTNNPTKGTISFEDNQYIGFLNTTKKVLIADQNQWLVTKNHLAYPKGSIVLGNQTPKTTLSVSTNQGVSFISETDKPLLVVSNNNGIGFGTSKVASTVTIKGDSPLHIRTKSNPNALVITNNNRIGIGVANPRQHLEVAGAILVKGYQSTIPAVGTIWYDKNNDQFWTYRDATSNVWIRLDSTPLWNEDQTAQIKSLGPLLVGHQHPLSDATLEVSGNTQLGSTILVTNGDNVGVHTLTPTHSLHVSGNFIVGTKTNPYTLSVFESRIGINSPEPTINLDILSSDQPLIIESHSVSDMMVISKNGFVGLGTSKPTERLVVNSDIVIGKAKGTHPGTIEFDQNKFKSFFKNNITNDMGRYHDWQVSTNATILYYSSGNIGIGLNQPKSSLTISGNLLVETNTQPNTLYFSQTGNLGIGTLLPTSSLTITQHSNNTFFQVSSSTSPNALIVKDSGLVGIHTDDPKTKLHIQNGALLLGKRESTNQLGTIWYDKDNEKFFGQLNDHVVDLSSKKPWDYEDYNVTRFNLGLGSSDSPKANLHVSGNALFTTAKQDTPSLIVTNNAVGLQIKKPLAAFHTQGTFRLDTKTATHSLTVSNNRFSIGQHNPIAGFHITHPTPLLIETATKPNAFLVTKNGFVGIGTLNYKEAFSVSGAITVSDRISSKKGTIWFKNDQFYGSLSPTTITKLGNKDAWSELKEATNWTLGGLEIGKDTKNTNVDIIFHRDVQLDGDLAIISDDTPILTVTNNKIGFMTDVAISTDNYDVTISGNVQISKFFNSKTTNFLTITNNNRIGIQMPDNEALEAQLHVTGNIPFIVNDYSTNLNSEIDDFYLRVTQNGTVQVNTKNMILPLAIAGGLKIAKSNTDSLSNKDREGTIQYDHQDQRFQGFLNGRWKTIAHRIQWQYNSNLKNLSVNNTNQNVPIFIGQDPPTITTSFNIKGSQPLHISGGTTANMFVITTNGKIGINTAFPKAMIHVSENMLSVKPKLAISNPSNKSVFIISSQNNVGISIASPNERLSVAGAVVFGNDDLKDNDIPTGTIRFKDKTLEGKTATGWRLMAKDHNWLVTKNIDTEETLGLYYNHGHVGINTNSPQALLSIVTDNRALHLTSSATPNLFVVTQNQIGINTQTPSASFQLISQDSIAPLSIKKKGNLFIPMVISNNGNILLGKHSNYIPTAPFQIVNWTPILNQKNYKSITVPTNDMLIIGDDLLATNNTGLYVSRYALNPQSPVTALSISNQNINSNIRTRVGQSLLFAGPDKDNQFMNYAAISGYNQGHFVNFNDPKNGGLMFSVNKVGSTILPANTADDNFQPDTGSMFVLQNSTVINHNTIVPLGMLQIGKRLYFNAENNILHIATNLIGFENRNTKVNYKGARIQYTQAADSSDLTIGAADERWTSTSAPPLLNIKNNNSIGIGTKDTIGILDTQLRVEPLHSFSVENPVKQDFETMSTNQQVNARVRFGRIPTKQEYNNDDYKNHQMFEIFRHSAGSAPLHLVANTEGWSLRTQFKRGMSFNAGDPQKHLYINTQTSPTASTILGQKDLNLTIDKHGNTVVNGYMFLYGTMFFDINKMGVNVNKIPLQYPLISPAANLHVSGNFIVGASENTDKYLNNAGVGINKAFRFLVSKRNGNVGLSMSSDMPKDIDGLPNPPLYFSLGKFSDASTYEIEDRQALAYFRHTGVADPYFDLISNNTFTKESSIRFFTERNGQSASPPVVIRAGKVGNITNPEHNLHIADNHNKGSKVSDLDSNDNSSATGFNNTSKIIGNLTIDNLDGKVVHSKQDIYINGKLALGESVDAISVDLKVNGTISGDTKSSKLKSNLEAAILEIDDGNLKIKQNKLTTDKLSDGVVPSGTIVMWNKSTIPTGWVICNGANGTPDLRNKFVRQVNADNEKGNTGGGNGTHEHTANWNTESIAIDLSKAPNHSHTVVNNSIALHSHTIRDYWHGDGEDASGTYDHSRLNAWESGPIDAKENKTETHQIYTGEVNHDHAISNEGASSPNEHKHGSGTTSIVNESITLEPPHWKLLFIMKI